MTIPLTRGQVATVDDDDYAALAAFRWHATPARQGGVVYYARRTVYLGGGRAHGRYTTVLMHTQLTGWARVDHIDHDGLNNTRANLREATGTQNNANRLVSGQGTSRYKGVSWHTQTRRWWARITVDGRQVSLRLHDTEEDAARAYNQAALKIFGEFSQLNDVPADL